MIKGLILIQAPPEAGWKLLGSFVPTAEEKPTDEVINAIISRFSESNIAIVNYRKFPYKYFCFGMRQENDPLLIGVYILENTDTLEIVRIFLGEIQTKIRENAKNAKQIPVVLKEIVDSRNYILEKLEKPKIIQDEVGVAANKLIESRQFEAAQERIKLARDVPTEIHGCYKRSIDFLKIQDYRKAESELGKARTLADRIGDRSLSEYFNLRQDTIKNIPLAEKELKGTYQTVVKALAKAPANLPYGEQSARLRRCMEILDMLENDDKIQQIQEMEELVRQAQDTLNKMNELDSKIKAILGYLN